MEFTETLITEGEESIVDEFIGSISEVMDQKKIIENDYKKLENDYKKLENDYNLLETYNKLLESKVYTIESELLRLNKTVNTSIPFFLVSVLIVPCFVFYRYNK